MRNADPRGYGAGGIWPLQHSTYKDRGYKLVTRSAMLAYRVVDRLTGTGEVGHWKYEEDSCGDVVGGNLWSVKAGAREGMPAWAFAWPTLLETAAGGGGGDVATPGIGDPVATGGGHAAGAPAANPARKTRNFSMKALPMGTQGNKDNRFEPKGVLIPLPDGAPGKAPAPGGGGGGGAGGGGGRGPEIINLGIGGRVWPTSGGSFPTFGGVRTNFSSGSPNTGIRVNAPRDPYRAPSGAR